MDPSSTSTSKFSDTITRDDVFVHVSNVRDPNLVPTYRSVDCTIDVGSSWDKKEEFVQR